MPTLNTVIDAFMVASERDAATQSRLAFWADALGMLAECWKGGATLDVLAIGGSDLPS